MLKIFFVTKWSVRFLCQIIILYTYIEKLEKKPQQIFSQMPREETLKIRSTEIHYSIMKSIFCQLSVLILYSYLKEKKHFRKAKELPYNKLQFN